MSDEKAKPSVLIIGFSVTEERTGYVRHLADLIKSTHAPLHIESRGIGGETLRLLPFIFDSLVTKHYDYIAFEIATSRRFFDDEKRYIRLLNEMAFKCRQVNAIPLFINLYREGIDYANDLLTKSIHAFCDQNDFPVVDMIDEFEAIRLDNKLPDYFRDGVHPTDIGNDRVSRTILEFLLRVTASERAWNAASIIYAPSLAPAAPSTTFTRGNVAMPVTEIREGETVDFVFDKPTAILGMLYLISPLSGDVVIATKAFPADFHKRLYDSTAYYYRYASMLFRPFVADRISISAAPGRPDIALRKGEPNEGPRVNSIVGFLVDNQLSNIYFQ